MNEKNQERADNMSINLVLSYILILILFSCQPNAKEQNDEKLQSPTPSYDSISAAKYGADEYGMKKYVIAFLKKGPNRDHPKAEADKLQAAHMDNINKLAEAGKLAVAGPFFGDSDLRGLYIFDVQSIEEAEALTNTDPAIQAGSLVMELHEWYGSAAVSAIAEIHETLQKTKM